MLCRKVMLEVGWLLEGSSLHPFAPQNALVEASPCSKLSPDTAVTAAGMRVLAIPSATHRRQLEPVVELTAFEGLFLLEKPVQCQPRTGIWVPNIPWGPGDGNIPPCHPLGGEWLLIPHSSTAPSHGNGSPANPNRTKSSTFSQQRTCACPLQRGSAGNVAQTPPQ